MKRLAFLTLLLFATSAHATVNEVTARNDYVAVGGTTTFAYTFKILEKTQITVLVDGILRTVDTHYSVSGLGDSAGGTVTLFTAPASGVHVSLIRDQPVQQLSIYNANEAFPATRLMTDLDKNIMVDQMQEEELRRALKFGQESFVHDVVVDDPIGSSCLAWNGLGTRVVNVACGSGGGGDGGNVPPIATGNVVFGGPAAELSQDLTGHFRYDNAAKSLIVGTLPTGPLAPGNVFVGLAAPSNATGMQALMVQTQQGTSPGIGLVTLGNDRVGISSWNFRGTGATNPIYGANFGVVFSTNGVANGLEIDVQNNSGTPTQGQALWLNGSGTTGRANAILIDTQDGSKWDRGILFKEGFVGGGATGSISGMGIHFEQSQDADFIVIQPRLGTLSNVAFKLTDPAFTVNRFELLNNGTVRGTGGLTTAAFPVFSFVDDVDSGMYQEAQNVLGWGVGGLRRLTLGTALNVWNSGAGANQGGNINLFDNTAVHSVGFLAADTINNTWRIRLPAVWGTASQCVITDGGTPIETWSYADCGSGSSGTVTTSGSPVTGALALFSGATAITSGNLSGDVTTTNTLVTTLANAGTAGTYGLVTTDAKGRVTAGTVINDVAHGGTGVATFAANGVLYGNAATSVLVTAQGGANTVLVSNGGAPAFTDSPTVDHITTVGILGVSIGPFGTGVGETGRLLFYERAANGTESVGFQAPDSIATSILWTLPATDSTGTQCLASNGSGVLSWGACSAGSGTGLTSLNGLTGATQTFTNDTNVTITSGGTAHVLGWAGTLSSTRGGTGQNTSSSTGVPNVTAGTWSVLAQLPKSLGGTGGTGGTAGQVGFWTSTTLTGSANFTWDNVGNVLTVSKATIGDVAPFVSRALSVTSVNPPARFERSDAATGVGSGTVLTLVHSTSGQMVNGFDALLTFLLRDADGIDNTAAVLRTYRDGADGSSSFALQTAVAGTLADRLTINNVGQMFYTATPTTGAFGLVANGTRTAELLFFTNNNTNAVGLVAPATSTGNFTWKLPQTLGEAGNLLFNDGSGQLNWVAPPWASVTCTDAAIRATLAVSPSIVLPAGCVWNVSGVAIPANKVIRGTDFTSGITATSACISVGDGTMLENLTLSSSTSCGAIAAGGRVRRFWNQTGSATSALAGFANQGDIVVTGPAGVDAPAYYVDNAGGGDAFDTLLTGSGAGAGLRIDARMSNASARPAMILHSLTSFSGSLLTIGGQSTEYGGGGGTFTGKLINGTFANNTVFVVDAAGRVGIGPGGAPLANTQLHVISGDTNTKIRLSNTTGGTGKSYALISNSNGSMDLHDDDDALPTLRFTAAGAIQFINPSSACRQLNFTTGAWDVC